MILSACRGCAGSELDLILSLGDQPPANALTPDPATRVPTAPLDLLFCTTCALVQLGESLDPVELFSDYPYFSTFSPAVEASARSHAERLVAAHGLGPDDLVMEIASNDGYLLRHYAAAGIPVLGIDPARNIAAVAEEAGVPTIPEFFTAELAAGLAREGRRARILHANNVLAHVPDVNDLVAGIEAVLDDDGIAIIETPSLHDLVMHLEYDTIYHEHVFYYSAIAVDALLRRHGLHAVDIEHIPLHGGSLRITAARRGAGPRAASSVQTALDEEHRAGLGSLQHFSDFAGRVDALRARQRAFCDEVRSNGRTLAGYGAAAKATVLLTAIGATNRDVAFVVDRSPHKQGRHIPNTGIPVLPPEALAERRPDFAMIFAWNFAEEVVAQRADYLDAGGRFVVPVPDVRVIAP